MQGVIPPFRLAGVAGLSFGRLRRAGTASTPNLPVPSGAGSILGEVEQKWLAGVAGLSFGRMRRAGTASTPNLPVPWGAGSILGEVEQKWLAGVAGFEPAHGGIKSRCLTAWLHPNSARCILRERAPIAARTAM